MRASLEIQNGGWRLGGCKLKPPHALFSCSLHHALEVDRIQVTYLKLPMRILTYAKLCLGKRSHTRHQISIEIEVVTRQCLKKIYKSFQNMIAAKIFSNCSDPMETTLQVLLSRDRLKFSLDDRCNHMPVVGGIAQLFLYRSERSERSQ